jgi:AraC family transcriptional regulator
MGVSPHRNPLQRRLDHAEALLRAGAVPMTNTALTCGFSSPAHFASSFKRTPRLFRRL